MRYLIIIDKESFYTDVYEYNNCYMKGMIVIDFDYQMISFDGINWNLIEFQKL